jgi:hypothetical protein
MRTIIATSGLAIAALSLAACNSTAHRPPAASTHAVASASAAPVNGNLASNAAAARKLEKTALAKKTGTAIQSSVWTDNGTTVTITYQTAYLFGSLIPWQQSEQVSVSNITPGLVQGDNLVTNGNVVTVTGPMLHSNPWIPKS